MKFMQLHFTKIAIILIAIVLVGVVFVSTPVTEHNEGFDSDGVYYAALAGDRSFAPDFTRIAPWCYRVLTPYLASLLPYETLQNFRILALLSNLISLVLFTKILETLRFQPQARLIGVLLYAGSFWTLRFSFYSPAYIDYQTQLLLLLAIYCTLRRAYILLPIVFLIAALQKESLAAYSIFSAIHIIRCGSIRRTKVRSLLIGAVIALPFAAIVTTRLLIHPTNTYSIFTMVVYAVQAWAPRFWPILVQAMFSSLGVIPILLLVNYRYWSRFLLWHPEWILYSLISLGFLFGGSDKARLFLYFLPLSVILALYTVKAHQLQTSSPRFLVWISVVLVVHWYIGGYFGPMGSFYDYLARMVPVHSAGQYVPYLLRNLGLAVALFTFSVQFLYGEWHFLPTIGFTRRAKPPNIVVPD